MPEGDTILIVAGEASADLHGAKVLEAVRSHHPGVSFFGVGGAAMRAAGLETVASAEDISVAGLTEVLLAIPRIFGILGRLAQLAAERRPKVAVLIDLPDFNLRLAKRLKRLGIPVVYYISPQVWAWRQGRVRQIKAVVDRMLVILPFEEDFYRQHGVAVEFVGHPLLEELPEPEDTAQARQRLAILDNGPVVALLPGSRKKEVSRHLPRMLEAMRLLADEVEGVRGVIPVASTIPPELVQRAVERSGAPVTVVVEQATLALLAADAAVVCSGTATLQTALLLRPMLVVYRVSWLTYLILKGLVKVTHIALVNLIAGKAVAQELIQQRFTAANVATELRRLLSDPAARDSMRQQMRAVRDKLGAGGAAARVAEAIASYLSSAKDAGGPGAADRASEGGARG